MMRAIRAHAVDRAGDGDGCGGRRASRAPACATASAAGNLLGIEKLLRVFYKSAGRCVEIQAFSGVRWKTHVLAATREIAKIRNCSESMPGGPVSALGHEPKSSK